MKKRPRRLSAAFAKTATTPGRFGDGFGGFGLSLLVKTRKYDGVAKSWSQRLWIDGGPVNVGLGQYPIVTLSEARARALDNRRMVERGEDPRKPRRSVPTFAAAAEAVIELHRPTWKNGERIASQWRASIRDYALPVLGGMTVDRITTADILAVVIPDMVRGPGDGGPGEDPYLGDHEVDDRGGAPHRQPGRRSCHRSATAAERRDPASSSGRSC